MFTQIKCVLVLAMPEKANFNLLHRGTVITIPTRMKAKNLVFIVEDNPVQQKNA